MSKMVRRNFFLTLDQDAILKKMDALSVSEHIRRAIDEYIKRHQDSKVTTSPTK